MGCENNFSNLNLYLGFTWMVGSITEPLGFVQDIRDVMVLFGGSIVFVCWTSPLQGGDACMS